MDPFERNVDGYYDIENQLPAFLRGLADQQFDAADEERAEMTGPEDVERRREQVREHFFDALGGLPETDCDLDPERTGSISENGFTIEKIVFQSLTNFHVTTNLYLPTDASADSPVPGVLFLCGHANTGKAGLSYQKACRDLAANGFAVLAVDPVGQGERHQSYDPETGETPRYNTLEHTYLGHQCALVGANVARYFVHDARCAVDYLIDRPEVDEDRIGVTGNSGGGTQTAYQMVADDRLDAAAPCCFLTSREAYMKTGQAQDAEQILWSAIDRGPRYDDFLVAFAPKPVLVGASQSDFLCIDGVHESVERASVAWKQFNAAENLELVVSRTTHGLDAVLREAVVNWFRRHLQDRAPDFETNDPETLAPEELYCLSDGEVNAAYADERNVVDVTRSVVSELNPRSRATVDGEYAAAMRSRVHERFTLDRETPALSPRTIAEERDGDIVWEKVFFMSEFDVVTTAILARTANVDDASSDRSTEPVQPTVVLLSHGTADLPDYREAVAALAAERGAALVFDPRGVGAVRSRDVNTPLANGGEYFDYHGTEYKLTSDALMLGTSLVAHRTFDVLRAGEYLRGRWGERDLGLVGAGRGAVFALYAAVADRSFESVVVEDISSFHERATASEFDPDHCLKMHDVVGRLDVPQLLPALRDRDVVRTEFDDGELPVSERHG